MVSRQVHTYCIRVRAGVYTDRLVIPQSFAISKLVMVTDGRECESSIILYLVCLIKNLLIVDKSMQRVLKIQI